MAKPKKGEANKLAKLGPNYFGIMLDYELDAVPGYWPARNATSDIEELMIHRGPFASRAGENRLGKACALWR